MMGGKLRHRSVTGSLILAGAALALSACGGHKEDDPITPSYVGNYQASMNLVANNCGFVVAGALSQIHRVSQEARNILVERDNVAYQGNVEVDNRGFVARSLAEGRPFPEGRLIYRNTANPNLFTAQQSEIFSSPTSSNPDRVCEVTYLGQAVRI